MQLYDCKVRLNGSVANEVVKHEITAAEIMVLRALHGEDSVVDIKAGRMDKRSHTEERQRLYGIYANGNTLNAETMGPRMAMLRGMFGHDTADLPVKLPDEYAAVPEVPTRTVVEDPNALVD